jgi:hypothetical protein
MRTLVKERYICMLLIYIAAVLLICPSYAEVSVPEVH